MSIIDASMSKNGFCQFFAPQRDVDQLSGTPGPYTSTRADSEGWQRIIDQYLVEWGRDLSQLEDEGISAPTPTSLRAASDVAFFLRDNRKPAPTRVVPSGDGGIVFEWDAGDDFVSLEIMRDAAAEINVFRSGRHLNRFPLGHIAV